MGEGQVVFVSGVESEVLFWGMGGVEGCEWGWWCGMVDCIHGLLGGEGWSQGGGGGIGGVGVVGFPMWGVGLVWCSGAGRVVGVVSWREGCEGKGWDGRGQGRWVDVDVLEVVSVFKSGGDGDVGVEEGAWVDDGGEWCEQQLECGEVGC